VARIEWDASLETGDPAVDHQHQAIHELLNQLESAADNELEVMRVLDFLTEYVVVHFATEEELMVRVAYPTSLAAPHIAEHTGFTDAVGRQVLAFRCGRLTSTEPLIAFLRDWLMTHVHDCDLQLVEYIHSRGVVASLPAEWIKAEQRVCA
jgi:hemerythrin